VCLHLRWFNPRVCLREPFPVGESFPMKAILTDV